MRVSIAPYRQAGGQTGRFPIAYPRNRCGKRVRFALPVGLCGAPWPAVLAGWFLAAWAVAGLAADAPDAAGVDPAAPAETTSEEVARPKDRAESIRSLTARLGIGEGATIVDLGAGRGHDTWLFAGVVGPTGRVYAQDITNRSIESIKKDAEKRGLSQVETVLGQPDDPCLPEASADLVYMRRVYHHFSKPREMLRGILHGLKPGGLLVVVDQHRGTLRDWVPLEVRQREHHWTAETTVVRQAREEGFAFVDGAEESWHEEQPFVLVFRRPDVPGEPDGDPDPPLPLAENAKDLLLPAAQPYQRPVFIALGEARNLIGPILARSSGPGLDIVLEEWATQQEERPPLPAGVELPSVLTEQGDPGLGSEPIDVVFFLDTYHLLFHGETLLAKLHERLAPGGAVYILDRKASEPLSRRKASHHRRIAREVVREEMVAAGFSLRREVKPPAADRFLLVFGKADADDSRN